MARRPNQLLRNLFIATLIILAATHPGAVETLTQLAAGLILAIVQGTADAAAQNPGAAILTAGALYITHHAHTHRPRRAPARH